MSIGLWQYLPYKGPRGLIHPLHGHWEKKEFDFKGNWGGLFCHQTLPDNSPPTKITEDAICPYDRNRISHRKPGWVGTCSQSPDYSLFKQVCETWRLAVVGWGGNSTWSLGLQAPSIFALLTLVSMVAETQPFTWKASQKGESPPNPTRPFHSDILPPSMCLEC